MIARDGGKLTQDQALLKFRGSPIAHAQGLHNFLPSGFADSIHTLPFLGNILLRQRSRLGNKNYESMRPVRSAFIQEHQSLRRHARQPLGPLPSLLRHVGPRLLGGGQRFFYSSSPAGPATDPWWRWVV